MSDPLLMPVSCAPDKADVRQVVRCAGRWLSEVRPESDVAGRVADFISRRFRLAYGAEPVLRIPRLLALTTAQGALLAAVGVRNAATEHLFLEDYLDDPVESYLPEPLLKRSDIVEIAHLAGVEAGVSRYLFAGLAVWLHNAGCQWVVCTGTNQLRNSFRRVGIDTHVIASADPDRLSDGGAGWGSYYEHQPVVMAMNVAQSMAALGGSGLLRTTRYLGEPSSHINEENDMSGGAYGFLA
ncbi:thermostable hemolysin [Marinobacter salinexigens]|nr:thermostable hemolysin [Marinobacter salinexigens]